jgi:hypothetical protein
MLAPQMSRHLGVRVVEHRPDLVERQPNRPVHQHHM